LVIAAVREATTVAFGEMVGPTPRAVRQRPVDSETLKIEVEIPPVDYRPRRSQRRCDGSACPRSGRTNS
jgi:hypothetical protein